MTFRFKQIKTWVGIGALHTGRCLDGFAPWECENRDLGQMLLCRGVSAYKGLYALASGGSNNWRALVGPAADTFLQAIKAGPKPLEVTFAALVVPSLACSPLFVLMLSCRLRRAMRSR